MSRIVGTSRSRVDDPTMLQGNATYLDDLRLPGMAHAVFVRSPMPHARIMCVDVDAARASAGVFAILTAADLDGIRVENMAPPGAASVVFGPLAADRVRLAGDPIAVVVATSRALAEDAAELVEVELDPLLAVASIEHALDSSRPPLWDELGSNVVWRDERSYGDIDGVFATAPQVRSMSFDSPRLGHVPMECGGCIAAFDGPARSLDVWAGVQSPNTLRGVLARAFGLDLSRVRVRTPRIGGSFGQKGQYRREDLAIAAAAKAVGRPVKWAEDRTENLLVAGQAREERIDVDVAFDDDGRVRALRVALVLNQGAYPTAWPRSVTVNQIRTLMPSAYRLEAFELRATIVASNKASYLPYRGPWSAETWVRERVLDVVADAVDIDPIAVRRRNLVTPGDQPTTMITGPTLDGVTLQRGLDTAERRFDFGEFRERQAAARRGGRLLGVGVACYLEPAPGPPDYLPAMMGLPISPAGAKPEPVGGRPATARVEIDGSVRIAITESPSGQGHRTTFAQVAADVLGLDPARITIVLGDTALVPYTPHGTGGSSAAHMTGGAVHAAAIDVADKAKRIAAHLLEADPDDLELTDGVARVRGTPTKAVPLAQIASTAWLAPHLLPPGEAPGFELTAWFPNRGCGWSQGTHVCEVEIDPATALVSVVRYLVVEDCGEVINPAVVAGQITGGVAQGISAVLYEHAAYDDDGNPQATSFMDYLLPTACEIPRVEIVHVVGDMDDDDAARSARGVGEGGTIGATAAVLNAVADALGGGDCVRSRLLPPAEIWRVLDERGLVAPAFAP